MKSYKIRSLMILLIIFGSCFLTGCKETYENNDKVRLAYFGHITELPLITAYEEGYFADEGLDVELVKLNYEDFASSLNNKSIDGGTCDYRILKSIEEGTNIKIGAGLHSGSIELLVGANSNIKKVDEFKNKKIGIENKGEGTMIATETLFSKYNINSLKDIEWVYLEENQLKESLKKGEIDGIVLWQNENEDNGDFKTIYKAASANSSSNSGHKSHGNDFVYISFAGISKEISDTCPEKAGGILRAWIQGANKVTEEKEECLLKAIEDKYIDGTFEGNNKIINQYMWMPSVKSAKENIKSYIDIQKSIGVLSNSVNEDEFYKNSFADVLPYWD